MKAIATDLPGPLAGRLVLYAICFVAGATQPILLVYVVKLLFKTIVEVVGWAACAITAMVALMLSTAPKRTPMKPPMKLAYPLAAGFGWFAAFFVSITPHIWSAITVPCGLAYVYFVIAEEESVSWWWTREDAVRILSFLEKVADFNVLRAAVGSTATVLMGGFAQMWMASKVLNVLGEVLRGGATRGLCTLSALSGMVAACFLHTWWLNAASLAQAFDPPTAIALILALGHCLVSKLFVNGTKMGKTIVTGHLLAMTGLFYDSYSKGQMSGASLFASVCFFAILAACKAMEELRARWKPDF
ncbi:MAM3 [Symbiodinium sp. CCMP2456]|nr:MAM3 [Symbiodinium sp. CCMP2456]